MQLLELCNLISDERNVSMRLHNLLSTTTISKPMITQQTKSNLEKVHSTTSTIHCRVKQHRKIYVHQKCVQQNNAILYRFIFTFISVYICIPCFVHSSKILYFFPISNDIGVRDYFQTFVDVLKLC